LNKRYRFTALLLLFALLASLLASCDDSKTPSTPESTVSEVSAEESLNGEIQYKTAVSLGKTYTKASEAGDSYPDTYGTELTDGVKSESDNYTDERFSGYTDRALSVIIDLGEDGARIYAFEAGYLSVSVAGIYAPATVTIHISDDLESWKRLGMCVKPAYVEGTVQRAELVLSETENARYVRFSFVGSSSWMFLDELTVYADTEGGGNRSQADVLDAYESDSATDGELSAAIGSVTTQKPDTSLTKTLISQGASYTLSRPSSTKQYTDSGSMLTDGTPTNNYYESGAWVGFSGSDALDITVDLGCVTDDICGISLWAYSRPATGITLPVYVDMLVSDDGEKFVRVSRAYTSADSSVTNFAYTFAPETCISARFVRFSIPEGEKTWMLFEEAAVYAMREEVQEELMYPALSIEKVSSETHSPESSDIEVNLIKGLKQQILDGAGLLKSDAASYCTPASSLILTDGIRSTDTAAFNGKWFKTWSGISRDIFYDLGYHMTVTGFATDFLQLKSWGIALPSTFTLYLSDDGVKWYPVSVQYLTDFDDDAGIYKINVRLAVPTVARYARFSFPVAAHTYLDELELFGTTEIKRGVVRLSGLGITPETLTIKSDTVGSYSELSDDILDGVKDIMLAYHNSSVVLDKNFFLAYAAYLNASMTITDTMFDGFLFLPNTGELPSGGRPYGDSVKSDWDYIYNDLFTENKNLDALNEAAGEIADALGLKDFKIKVFLTIMYPSKAITNFGDVDGDGVTEDLSDDDDMMKVIKWYVKLCTGRFEMESYDNLELCGWYWFDEAVDVSEGDIQRAALVSKYLEDKCDSQLFWIPYFQAEGYSSWAQCGFSAAYMQPNYAFDLDVPLSRIENAVKSIKRYNMRIEMEFDPQGLSNELYYEKYMDYLGKGVEYGYMTQTGHAYYQGITGLYSACRSSDKRIRLLYDYTYQFIKGTLKIMPDTPENVSVSTSKNSLVAGSLGESNSIRKYSVYTSPSHGTVTVDENGAFTYFPNKGFTGTDTFTFTFSEQLGDSAPASVTVTVR